MNSKTQTSIISGHSDQLESDMLRQEILTILSVVICIVGLATTILVSPDFSHKWGGQFLVFLSLLVIGEVDPFVKTTRWPK